AVAVLAACSKGGSHDLPVDLRLAAGATANASGFVVTTEGVEAIYQAPDRSVQVEHGQSVGSSGGTPEHPLKSTTVKVVIGDRYYVGDSTGDEVPVCDPVGSPPASTVDVLLRILRALAAAGGEQQESNRYRFAINVQLPAGSQPMSGDVTVR